MYTPWGASQSSKKLARGIVFYETAGHGGIHLSPERQEAMPEALKLDEPWYEEDCEWARVYCAFPGCFKQEDVAEAKKSLTTWHPEAYERYYGEVIPEGQSHVKDRQLFQQKNRERFIVQAAWGEWFEHCPRGFVFVLARKESTGEEGCFLVPVEDYHGRGPHGFLVDETKHRRVERPTTV